MSFEIFHLIILGITVAVIAVMIPGVVRRLSSEGATKHDWSSVLRGRVVPLVAIPPPWCGSSGS